MTRSQFLEGFLRIASRVKEDGRRSTKFKRRFTGAKGIGRLASHKLAGLLEIESTPANPSEPSISARIDWRKIEELGTLEEIPGSGAIQLRTESSRPARTRSGTIISLRNLKRRWSKAELTRFLAEVQMFSPPKVLIDLPKHIQTGKPLLSNMEVRDATRSDPGFDVRLDGEFDVGDPIWENIAAAASWIIEISAAPNSDSVQVAVTPTKHTPPAHRKSEAARGTGYTERLPI